MKLVSQVKRGPRKGVALHPHRHADGRYVVSTTRYKKDYVYVTSVDEAARFVSLGYSLRMSNPAEGIRAPSLISPESIAPA